MNDGKRELEINKGTAVVTHDFITFIYMYYCYPIVLFPFNNFSFWYIFQAYYYVSWYSKIIFIIW